jgi:hypothetical protein
MQNEEWEILFILHSAPAFVAVERGGFSKVPHCPPYYFGGYKAFFIFHSSFLLLPV